MARNRFRIIRSGIKLRRINLNSVCVWVGVCTRVYVIPYANAGGRVSAKLVAVLVTNIRNEFRASFNGTSRLEAGRKRK